LLLSSKLQIQSINLDENVLKRLLLFCMDVGEWETMEAINVQL